MKVGIVSPYSFDVPGGVQFHIRDLADWLINHGHEVSVLAPADEGTDVPDYVVSTGKSVAIPYNGSVARLSIGPLVSARVNSWLSEGGFDVVHIHEPLVPSVGMLTLRAAEVPIVATFHSNQARSRTMWALRPVLQPLLDAITAPIAVSAEARRTVVEHLGLSPVIIPNGVALAHFHGEARPQWAGRRYGANNPPVICFLGRLDEPRKGLPVLADAIPQILATHPQARFLIAGRGTATAVREALAPYAANVTFLGGLSEAAKVELFASADIYTAPQTGGESFGIVLVEAMAGGAHVVASDIQAFRDVLDNGRAGDLFRTGDGADLARVVNAALARPAGEREAMALRAQQWQQQFDWESVGRRILAVYDFAVTANIDRPDMAAGGQETEV